jgi:hypothetical protein
MVLPPRHVYSAIVRSEVGFPCSLKVVHVVPPENRTEVEKIDLPKGSTVSAKARVIDQGSYKITSHIQSVEASGQGMTAVLSEPFEVNAPVKDLPLSVRLDRSGKLVIEL